MPSKDGRHFLLTADDMFFAYGLMRILTIFFFIFFGFVSIYVVFLLIFTDIFFFLFFLSCICTFVPVYNMYVYKIY